jgi:acyl carrier protein
MEITEIFETVKKSIGDSCGIEEEKIKLESTLFDDLGIDSIDMVDILYAIETTYDITLKASDFDKDARAELQGEPYEIDGVITEAGLQALRRRLPEIDQSRLKPGITMHEIIKLITVHSLCKAILQKLEMRSA